MALFDGNLKQRLIGTLVLIVLAVVFLPMIFNNKGEKLPETIVNVPSPPIKPIQPADQPQPTPTTPTQPTVAQNPPATEPTNNTTTTESTVAPPNANGITPTWSIQVAAVASLQNAEAFMEKLRQANYNAYIRSEGNTHRVLVGPFIEKKEASRVQQLIQKQFKEKGIIREFRPERK